MTVDQAIAFLLFAVVAAGTPGPSNVMLTATGAIVGIFRGIPCLLGVTLGMGFMMFVVAYGLGSIVLGEPIVLKVLNWCGIALLLWLSWKIATAGRGGDGAEAKPVGFVTAATFVWVNPKSWLVSTTAAGTYLQAESGSPLTQSAWLGALFFLAALPSCLPWLAIGAALQRFLRTDRSARVFNVSMGLLLASSVILLVI